MTLKTRLVSSLLSQLRISYKSVGSISNLSVKKPESSLKFRDFFSTKSIASATSSTSLPIRPTLKSSSGTFKESLLNDNLSSISTSMALTKLRSQPNHYVISFLVGKRYRLTTNDLVTVPHIKDLRVGDLIKLTRLTEVGSRNFTIRAIGNGTVGHAALETKPPPSNQKFTNTFKNSDDAEESPGLKRVICFKPEIPHYLDDGLVDATAIVVEHTRGKMSTVIKKKRRKGYRKTIKSKPYYTQIRLCEIKFPTTAET
ncbi:expressed protein [Phakopsora pachyrhizi]|uniref:Large ribosomal subunit protein bL21m n=1 Tax=Phakopsora pachyrhizi TaxID=170000 RepID=A0AAV0B4A8_PHAPC|nr:expressed protein [Phakopsora pachyrhizi]